MAVPGLVLSRLRHAGRLRCCPIRPRIASVQWKASVVPLGHAQTYQERREGIDLRRQGPGVPGTEFVPRRARSRGRFRCLEQHQAQREVADDVAADDVPRNGQREPKDRCEISRTSDLRPARGAARRSGRRSRSDSKHLAATQRRLDPTPASSSLVTSSRRCAKRFDHRAQSHRITMDGCGCCIVVDG